MHVGVIQFYWFTVLKQHLIKTTCERQTGPKPEMTPLKCLKLSIDGAQVRRHAPHPQNISNDKHTQSKQ